MTGLTPRSLPASVKKQESMSQLERAVYQVWSRLPWRMFTACSGCKEQRYCAGKSRDKVRCLTCFGETL
jgi:hypothetical protein